MPKGTKKTSIKKVKNDKLVVNGSFLDIMKAAVKNADSKSAKKSTNK